MAGTAKRRPATGRRVSLSFGVKKAAKGAKGKTTKELVAKIPESTIKALESQLT